MTWRQRLGIAAINLQTKFEVSNYTHYEAVQNVQIGVVCGHLGVTQGHRQGHHSIERIRLPIRL